MAETNDYEKLLESAYEKIKPVESKIDRFEIPNVEGHIEGHKTIVTNFRQICDYMRRDYGHVLKFILKELAAAGSLKTDRLILARKVPGKQINDKIQQYASEYVICKECRKPDTELIKQDRVTFMHCLACGAKHSMHT